MLGIPTERLRDGDLLHAHVEVAIRSDPDGPPTLDVLHHQGHNPTEDQWLFLRDKLDGNSVADGTWVLQSRPDEDILKSDLKKSRNIQLEFMQHGGSGVLMSVRRPASWTSMQTQSEKWSIYHDDVQWKS